MIANTIKKNFKKRFVIVTIIYLLVMTGFCIVWATSGLNNGIILKVSAYGKGTYRSQQLTDGNSFVSGMAGDLRWKPKTFTEAILLTTISNNGIDLLDVTGMLLIAGLILFTFWGSNDSAPFTKNVSTGFMLLIFAIGISGTLMDMSRMFLAHGYIPYITNGRFHATVTMKGISYNYLIYPILMALTRIPQKGLELQNEQELTI